MKFFSNSAILAVAAMLALASGCAGSNFVRPDPASFALGQTTQDDIAQRMGKPYKVGEVVNNGTTVPFWSYAYSTATGEPLHAGVTPARSQGFYFFEGKVVGTEFSSSFKADATDFDASKVAQVEKGKSTKDDVVRLFGPAGGEYIYPMTASRNERALVYVYSQTKGSAFNLRFYTKTLVVSHDEQGTVTNVAYSAQGNKD